MNKQDFVNRLEVILPRASGQVAKDINKLIDDVVAASKQEVDQYKTQRRVAEINQMFKMMGAP